MTTEMIDILVLPKLYVPTHFEMCMSIETWEARRKDCMAHAAAAWDMHSAAIDDGLSHDEIEDIAIGAEVMEREAMDAWHKLGAAKAALLARMN